jgi:lipopolysaccharide transport system ATP-binding protein
LIGHNGAGKSTLLKILNGLINPDEGKVVMKGRVGALIELGAGFNPVLSGRENIYNNGAILGFTRKEIDEKLQYIIDFAELEEFIDMPVRNYSSGMKVRLGFAVAAQMEPDVLIIDEVLAVGDLGFVLKCFKTIDTILPNTAIVFVSHSMPMVSRICNKIILMDKGAAKFQGEEVSKAIDLYYTRFASNDSNVLFNDYLISFKSITLITNSFLDGNKIIKWGEDLKIEIEILINDLAIKNIDIILIILDKEQRPVASIMEKSINIADKKELRLRFTNREVQLSKGNYSLNIAINANKSPAYRANSIANFQVTHEKDTWEPFLLKTELESL